MGINGGLDQAIQGLRRGSGSGGYLLQRLRGVGLHAAYTS